ncbi:hypothetical protein NITHO_1210003 [Nitrolancea hollandica Lb]|uniref:Uncharacterized protein n=1 Tax=Nitrolancea hollandica Lb TaxID=1129897 RepID=I4ECT2_9BACT|nr:hypothetical protein NITHO_1210003 [Nitrolancea hollandica Lb]
MMLFPLFLDKSSCNNAERFIVPVLVTLEEFFQKIRPGHSGLRSFNLEERAGLPVAPLRSANLTSLRPPSS